MAARAGPRRSSNSRRPCSSSAGSIAPAPRPRAMRPRNELDAPAQRLLAHGDGEHPERARAERLPPRPAARTAASASSPRTTRAAACPGRAPAARPRGRAARAAAASPVAARPGATRPRSGRAGCAAPRAGPGACPPPRPPRRCRRRPAVSAPGRIRRHTGAAPAAGPRGRRPSEKTRSRSREHGEEAAGARALEQVERLLALRRAPPSARRGRGRSRCSARRTPSGPARNGPGGRAGSSSARTASIHRSARPRRRVPGAERRGRSRRGTPLPVALPGASLRRMASASSWSRAARANCFSLPRPARPARRGCGPGPGFRAPAGGGERGRAPAASGPGAGSAGRGGDVAEVVEVRRHFQAVRVDLLRQLQ